MKFTIGQPVILAIARNWGFELVDAPVVSVGRRWATVAHKGITLRFDMETRKIDGGQFASPGRVYLSHDEIAEEQLRRQLATKIRSRVHNPALQDLPHYKLVEILALLENK